MLFDVLSFFRNHEQKYKFGLNYRGQFWTMFDALQNLNRIFKNIVLFVQHLA